MGFSVTASFAILFLAGLVSLAYLYTSAEYAMSLAVDAGDERTLREYARLYGDIDVVYINATQQGAVYDLVVKVYNAGDVELRSKRMSFIVNGTLREPDYYSSQYLLPGTNLTVAFYSIPGTGTGRLRVVTEYGSSAYAAYEVV